MERKNPSNPPSPAPHTSFEVPIAKVPTPPFLGGPSTPHSPPRHHRPGTLSSPFFSVARLLVPPTTEAPRDSKGPGKGGRRSEDRRPWSPPSRPVCDPSTTRTQRRWDSQARSVLGLRQPHTGSGNRRATRFRHSKAAWADGLGK